MSTFATNLNKEYANGENPNIVGRDKVMKAIMLTLLRNRKPNVLLYGEPGVGKTSLAHLLAYLIANKLTPPALHGFTVMEINTNSLLAGDGYRGTTEAKFAKLIEQCLENGKVILFIDEFHTAESLGKLSNNSTPGFGNTLKPYLTRGDFRVIGATTNEEMKQIKDDALLRRFQKIHVPIPDDEAVKNIIRNTLKECIGDHAIKYDKNVVDKIFDMSVNMPGNNPDKAIDLTDLTVANAVLSATDNISIAFVKQTFELMNTNFKTTRAEADALPLS